MSAGQKQKQQIIADENKYVLQTYGRATDVAFSHGMGSYLYDFDGR